MTSTGATHVCSYTNVPDYHKWLEQFPSLQHDVLAGAAANDARLIVLENSYIMYGPHGVPMAKDMALRGEDPCSSTRRQMTTALMEAHLPDWPCVGLVATSAVDEHYANAT